MQIRKSLMLLSALYLCTSNCCLLADEQAAAKSETTSSATPTSSADPNSEKTPQPADPKTTATTTAPPSQTNPEVAPGPLEAERKALRLEITKAEKDGVGVSAYIQAFKAIEKSAQAGDSEESLRPRIAKLLEAVKWQQKNSAKNGGMDYSGVGYATGYRIGKEMAKKILKGQ